MSTTHIAKRIARIGFASILSALTVTSAADSGRHVTVSGYEIYYGVVPTEVIARHPPGHEERTMHGGRAAGRDGYHLLVALFDAAGTRVTQAQVSATVTELGLAGTTKALEPMSFGEAASYGGYFVLSGAGPYKVELQAQVPGRAAPLKAVFEFKR